MAKKKSLREKYPYLTSFLDPEQLSDPRMQELAEQWAAREGEDWAEYHKRVSMAVVHILAMLAFSDPDRRVRFAALKELKPAPPQRTELAPGAKSAYDELRDIEAALEYMRTNLSLEDKMKLLTPEEMESLTERRALPASGQEKSAGGRKRG